MEHIPVMRDEVVAALENIQIHTVFDGTCGGGGHAMALLSTHPEIVCYVAGDRDSYALQRAREHLQAYQKKMSWFHGDFCDAPQGLYSAIVVDLGVSSFQLDTPERGFSFMRDGPLDMRMDQRQPLTASDIIHTWTKDQIANAIYLYGQEGRSRVIADYIFNRRRVKKFLSTLDLAEGIAQVVPRRGKLHPATKTFQALRIVVNDELASLPSALTTLAGLLAPGGRLVVISFHSLEDGIVKRSFLQVAKEKEYAIVTKKPLVPSREECRKNPRARSAKLRVLEKKSSM